MKLVLEVEWVPGIKVTQFADMLRSLLAANPQSIEAAIPCVENAGFVAKVDAAGFDLSIHMVSDFGECLPSRVAVLHSRARTSADEFKRQIEPFIRL